MVRISRRAERAIHTRQVVRNHNSKGTKSYKKKEKRNASIMHFFSIPGVRVTCCCFFFRIRFVGPGVGSVKMEAPQADKVCKPDNTPVGSRRYRKKKQHDAIQHTPQLSSIKYRSWVYVVLAPNSTLHFCFHCCCSVTQKWITVLHNVQYPTGWEGMRQVRKKKSTEVLCRCSFPTQWSADLLGRGCSGTRRGKWNQHVP